jgi:hypothetical protein
VTLSIDLSACEYLDSTFLGCLVTLHRKYDHPDHVRLQLVASSATRHSLLHLSRLENLFEFFTDPPEMLEPSVEVDVMIPDRDELGRHIAEAHRQLAELGGTSADGFDQITKDVNDDLARE